MPGHGQDYFKGNPPRMLHVNSLQNNSKIIIIGPMPNLYQSTNNSTSTLDEIAGWVGCPDDATWTRGGKLLYSISWKGVSFFIWESPQEKTRRFGRGREASWKCVSVWCVDCAAKTRRFVLRV